MAQYIKPSGVTGLNTGHSLYANIDSFYEFGQLNKELVSDTAITTTATTASDADLGSCKLFDETADALSETLTAIEESTVLVIYKGAGTRNDGDNSLFRVVDYNSGGTKYQLWYDGYSGGSWEILYDGGYGTDRRLNSTAFTTDGQYTTGNTVAVTTSRTGTMKFAVNGSVDTSDTQTTAALAGPPELALLSEVGSVGSMYVAAVVYFDKVLNDTELQSVTSDPWAMLDAAGDSTAPTFSVAPAVAATTEDGHTISSTIDEDGTIYGIRMTNGATAPADGDEVITWHDAGVSGDVLEVRSVSASSGVSADLVFNTGTSSTAYDYYIVAEDDEGTPNVQASATLVEATTSAPQFSVDSITSGTIRAGDSVTVGLSNANATGKTLTLGGLAVTPTAQDASSITFDCPDPKTFGAKTLSYNTSLTVEVADGGNSDTIQLLISPDAGAFYTAVAAIQGIFANDTGLEVGDLVYGEWTSGTGSVNLAYGAVTSSDGGNFRYWIQDLTDGVWGSAGNVPFSDSVAPVITLVGDNPLNIDEGGSYSDPGATAVDNVDGDLTGSINVGGDTVDVNTIGTYTITYDVADAAGNSATQVTRTVNINDVTAPVITLLGTSPVTHEHGTTYVDAGYTATDNHDGNISGDVVVTGAVNPNVVGQYTLTFNVSDAAGNPAATVYRTVNVTDQAAPVITLNGANPLNIDLGVPFTDPGATATDAVDGSVTVQITGSVNPNIAGTYTRYYNATDAAGNNAVEVTRTVNVVADATIPVITLNGGAVNLDVGDTYTELGATASDNVDGDITDQIVIDSSAVDTSVAGIYVVTYNVTDSSGNAAVERNRLVTVSGTVVTPPVQSNDSWKIQLVNPGATYTDPALTNVLDSQGADVSGTAVWSGEEVDTNATLTAKVIVVTMDGTVTNAAGGQVSFTPDGSLPKGRYQYEAKALDDNGDEVIFSTGTYTVN